MEITEAFNLKRMFLGDVPLLFYLEILFRTTFLFIYALVMLRLMGKRGLRQMSAFDYVIIIALGSAVGDPMFYPEVPLIAAMVVIAVVVALNRTLAYAVQLDTRLQTFVEGDAAVVIRDGYIEKPMPGQIPVAKEELFAILRAQQVAQLGQVSRCYLEQTGKVSIFLHEKTAAPPGLPIVPPWNIEEPSCYEAETAVPEPGPYACRRCGFTVTYEAGDAFTLCPHCRYERWTEAVLNPVPEKLAYPGG